ncbi:type VII secretion protein EccB [Nocardia asteroides]|uniref:type VII secretion protein EccB n=1 Tax=Nocardia asteroides TaxID=1824 RepID=UPI001E4EAFF7|nr:type VII secretion protein EccB [Nocardia asteroides]UGT60029.1 type VII secretion protein EccB [Nocardia asteroides]
MPSKPTTRWQVSGYRFLVRRMEHALVRRDVRMLHDPMKSQSRAYAVGLVLALVVLAGCGVLALLRPQDKIGSNTILIGKESGGVYVVIGDTVHPALNLASARLAAGEAAKPAIVKESELGKKPRGQLIGIPGAPAALLFDKKGAGRAWTVCDQLKMDGGSDLSTSVLVGDPDTGAKADVLPGERALLVQGRDSAYLIYDTKRARVDMSSRAVTDALGITGVTPRPVSDGLLNAVPEVLPLVAPRIDGVGEAPGYSMDGHRIGDVVQLSTTDEYYVVLRDGLQGISALTADIIRNSTPGAGDATIPQSMRTGVGVSKALQVDDYPRTAPTLVQPKDRPVSCLTWRPIAAAADNGDGARRAELEVLTGVDLPLPDDARTVPLAKADGSGPNADAVYLKPSTGAYVQSTGIDPDSSRRDSLFYVGDTGVRYGIKNAEAAKALGMENVPAEPAPWPIVGLLAAGPSLGREEAMVAHDGVAPDPAPADQPVAAAR